MNLTEAGVAIALRRALDRPVRRDGLLPGSNWYPNPDGGWQYHANMFWSDAAGKPVLVWNGTKQPRMHSQMIVKMTADGWRVDTSNFLWSNFAIRWGVPQCAPRYRAAFREAKITGFVDRRGKVRSLETSP